MKFLGIGLEKLENGGISCGSSLYAACCSIGSSVSVATLSGLPLRSCT